MGNVLNNGYGLWIPTFTLDGSTKIFQTAMMFQNTGAATASANNAAMRTVWAGTGDPFNATMFYSGYTFARSECYVNIAGVVTYDINETAIIGSKASSLGTPINTSILVKKNTNIVGRRYRGRFMFPNLWIPEANISQAGIISGTPYTDLQTLLQATIADQITAGMPPVLGHSSSEIAPTPFTTITVQPKIGTMRRRIRGY